MDFCNTPQQIVKLRTIPGLNRLIYTQRQIVIIYNNNNNNCKTYISLKSQAQRRNNQNHLAN